MLFILSAKGHNFKNSLVVVCESTANGDVKPGGWDTNRNKAQDENGLRQ